MHRTQLIRGTPSIAPDGEKKNTESSLILREILGPGGNGGAGAEVTATCRWIAIWMARAAHFDPKAIGSVSGPERNRLWARRVRTATLCSPYWVFTRSCARGRRPISPRWAPGRTTPSLLAERMNSPARLVNLFCKKKVFYLNPARHCRRLEG